MDLFYPEISVLVGPYTFNHGINVVVWSEQAAPYDWARLTFTPEFLGEVTLTKGETGSVSMGYGGQLVPVFSGTVTEDFATASGGTHELLLKDKSTQLQRTPINLVFTRATPQEIVAYCCKQAGVSKVELSEEQYSQRPTIPMMRTNALEAIRAINSVWGITVPSYFIGDTFVWGKLPPQPEQLILEYGINVVALRKAGQLWELETASLPFLRHSQTVQVKHPLVNGQQVIKRIIHRSDAKGFIRTLLYF